MPEKPHDRVDDIAPAGDEPQPKVYLVVGGLRFIRPSLETYYAKTPEANQKRTDSVCSCNAVAGTYCQCNKVCTCNLVSTPSRATCSCVGYTAPRSGTRSGGGGYCSCNKICTCVPVH